jgi:hypothetical protein
MHACASFLVARIRRFPALEAELSAENFSFCQNKFNGMSCFPCFLLSWRCKNRFFPSVVHRNKLE